MFDRVFDRVFDRMFDRMFDRVCEMNCTKPFTNVHNKNEHVTVESIYGEDDYLLN